MYTIKSEQSGKKYFLSFKDNKIIVNKPVFYNDKNKSIIDLYKIMIKQDKILKCLYYKHFKNKVSWKKFKKSYYNTTKFYISHIQKFN